MFEDAGYGNLCGLNSFDYGGRPEDEVAGYEQALDTGLLFVICYRPAFHHLDIQSFKYAVIHVGANRYQH